MADAFVDSARAAGKPARAREAGGVKGKIRTITYETAASDGAGDVKRLFNVGAHEIPVRCLVMCDATAGLTAVELGLYRPSLGAVVDRDALMSSIDLSAGYAFAAAKDGLSALGIEKRGISTFAELAAAVVTTDVIGHIPFDSYDVALTQVSDVSAVGTVTVILETIENQ